MSRWDEVWPHPCFWLALAALCTGATWLTFIVLEFLCEREHRRAAAMGSFTSTGCMFGIGMCIAGLPELAGLVFLILHCVAQGGMSYLLSRDRDLGPVARALFWTLSAVPIIRFGIVLRNRLTRLRREILITTVVGKLGAVLVRRPNDVPQLPPWPAAGPRPTPAKSVVGRGSAWCGGRIPDPRRARS